MGKGGINVEQMGSVAFHRDVACQSGIVVKNTFIDFDFGPDFDDCSLNRQTSEPARPMKRLLSKTSMATCIPEDPAGPEPEPEVKEQVKAKVPWDRMITGERWSNEGPGEADEILPEYAQACEAVQEDYRYQTAWAASQGPEAMSWAGADGVLLYGYVAWPGAGVGQGFVPGYVCMPAQEDSLLSSSPEQFQALDKRRRRRAGGSLIDLAKKRMEERLAEEGLVAGRLRGVAAQQPFFAASGATAAASSPDTGAKSYCAACDRTAPSDFRFCHHCGQQLQAVA